MNENINPQGGANPYNRQKSAQITRNPNRRSYTSKFRKDAFLKFRQLKDAQKNKTSPSPDEEEKKGGAGKLKYFLLFIIFIPLFAAIIYFTYKNLVEIKKLQNELTVYEISQKKGEEERMIHVKELDSKETEIQRKQTILKQLQAEENALNKELKKEKDKNVNFKMDKDRLQREINDLKNRIDVEKEKILENKIAVENINSRLNNLEFQKILVKNKNQN